MTVTRMPEAGDCGCTDWEWCGDHVPACHYDSRECDSYAARPDFSYTESILVGARWECKECGDDIIERVEHWICEAAMDREGRTVDQCPCCRRTSNWGSA